jgi:hypothetical protein
MFGYSLSHDEERAVLELLGRVATADREPTRDEKQYVVNLSHDFNASAEGVFRTDEQKSLAEICEDFQEETARKIALVYLVQLSFVDGLYEEDEWLGVREIGDTLGVADREVADLEDWVRRGLEWEEAGRELLGLESYWKV